MHSQAVRSGDTLYLLKIGSVITGIHSSLHNRLLGPIKLTGGAVNEALYSHSAIASSFGLPSISPAEFSRC
nr:hypothetical protein CFP56_79359 [Quercus suber]